MIAKCLEPWIEGQIETFPQNPDEVTLCQLIERIDGRIIWSEDVLDIYNKYRAFTSWPGIFTYWKRDTENLRLKLKEVILKQDSQEKGRFGEVIELDGQIGIKANLGVILLEKVQLEGKNVMPIQEFVNGYQDFIGSILK